MRGCTGRCKKGFVDWQSSRCFSGVKTGINIVVVYCCNSLLRFISVSPWDHRAATILVRVFRPPISYLFACFYFVWLFGFCVLLSLALLCFAWPGLALLCCALHCCSPPVRCRAESVGTSITSAAGCGSTYGAWA